MISLSRSFFPLLRLKATLLFFQCFLFVFLEQLHSDPQQKFPGTAVKANNHLFSFRACGHQQTREELQSLNNTVWILARELRSGTISSGVGPRSHHVISPFHLLF